MGGAVVIERISKRDTTATATATVPRHVAIIMDGNRRWATANNLPQIEGHRRGVHALRRVVIAAARAGIDVLTASRSRKRTGAAARLKSAR